MAVFMKALLPGTTAEQYDALDAELQALPGDTFAGCLSYVCVPTDACLEIYDLLESQEAMDTFGALIMPIAEKRGMPSASGPPAVSPVHRSWMSGA
ncbi:hypothetical protein [Streptomyces sp. NBC_00887]|uniref:hypothetical protein n=1 Tax=Streptomyces sp. NBC_00887 TaxID=2975859 RepID=UPI003867FEDF|nr:hypothetical protein OG844_09210 [Streptomyces sp. NBC_00887]WSY34807.1 hypothetical protein OG844_36390 [Streptomyces sp. NBC_00887]